MRGTDWSVTPLGPVKRWPASLRATVDMLLVCSFPMVALWGPELVQIYNDGYAEIMAAKHPRGMGQPTAECWPEVWEFNRPIYERVHGGETVTLQDQLFPITRHGHLEDATFSLCYSPLRDESGAVAGVLVTVFETTERVRTEEALRESEGRLRALVTATANVVYRMSSDWTHMQELYGSAYLSHTESSDVAWLEKYIPPDSQALVQTTIAESIAAKRIFELEHRVYQADGSEGWVMSRAVPLLDAQGEVYEWFGAAYDVTERKRSEEALRESEDLRRIALEGGGMGAWRWDMPNEMVYGDAVFQNLWGFPPSDGPRRLSDYTDRMSGQGRTEMAELVSRAIAAGAAFDGQLEVVDGPRRGHWVRWRGCAGREQPKVLYGISFDMTDQQESDKRLQESEGRLRLFMENVREYALVQTDLEGTITSWNPGAERLFGFASETMVGRVLRELAVGLTEDVSALEDGKGEVRSSFRVEKEEWLTRGNGTRFLARWVSEPVYDEAGRRRGVAHVLRDETDRNRAQGGRLMAAEEEERRRVARELHDDLGQRAALIGLEVGQMQRMNGEVGTAAKESLERLGGYVAALSERIRSVSHRLHPSLLEDLGLPVALRALVEEHRGTGRDVEMHIGDIPALPIETATALYRIAQEGLGNAERHAPGAPVRASLTRPSHSLELRIEDEGPGFDLAEARQKGTLGLTSMRERAQIAGGELHIETRPGEGTTLRVRLPLPLGS